MGYLIDIKLGRRCVPYIYSLFSSYNCMYSTFKTRYHHNNITIEHKNPNYAHTGKPLPKLSHSIKLPFTISSDPKLAGSIILSPIFWVEIYILQKLSMSSICKRNLQESLPKSRSISRTLEDTVNGREGRKRREEEGERKKKGKKGKSQPAWTLTRTKPMSTEISSYIHRKQDLYAAMPIYGPNIYI